MSMPKALLGLFVITGMSGCMDHIHFSGDNEFLKITTVLGEIDQVERCIIVGVDSPPLEGSTLDEASEDTEPVPPPPEGFTRKVNDNEPHGDSDFYTCDKVLTLSEAVQEYRERIQAEVLIDGVSVDSETGLPEGTYRVVN